ncbi:DNA-3-methyladenine glycosylase family protein [Aestuariimicrobium soli]|uniref:DNA-3-methyladenine glycosylase family protein n=1 Tax=Aestuariimicrobium soli TaxID=2035834 RepID=UPI003EBCACFD
MSSAAPQRRLVVGLAVGLDDNLSRHQRGADLTHRQRRGSWWRATTTPEGPALVQVKAAGGDVEVIAWGEGAAWALDQAPRLLGDHDDLARIPVDHPLRIHPLVGPLARRHLRPIGASHLVAEALAPTILEQKVTGAEAFSAIRTLVRRYGTPAPGPASGTDATHPAAGMFCPPTAVQWATIPSWAYLQAGVEPRRGQVVVRTLGRAASLQRLLDRTLSSGTAAAAEALGAALRSLPGIGPWTTARVLQAVVGDPDAWSIDDYHVPGWISWNLTGVKGDSAAAAAALEPFAGDRYRVELLLGHGGRRPERHGPRRSLPTHLPQR